MESVLFAGVGEVFGVKFSIPTLMFMVDVRKHTSPMDPLPNGRVKFIKEINSFQNQKKIDGGFRYLLFSPKP